jgi:hypothetical protein
MTRRAGNGSQLALNRCHRDERSDVAIQGRRLRPFIPLIASLTFAMTKPFANVIKCV